MLVYVLGLAALSILVTSFTLYCVVVIVRSHALHKPSHMAICSLLCAHLIQGVVVIPSYALKRSKIEPRGFFCDIFRFSYMLTNYASCLSLLLVTIDRYLTVKLPLYYRVKSTSSRMMFVVFGVWLYAGMLCVIPFVPGDNKVEDTCSYNPQKLWTTFMVIINTLLPFFTIFVLYVEIFRTAQKVTLLRVEGKTSRTKIKSMRIFIIVFCYVVCWGPGCVYYLVLSLCREDCFANNYFDSTTEEWITFVMKLMTFVDGVIAPCMYCYGNAKFKTAAKKYAPPSPSDLGVRLSRVKDNASQYLEVFTNGISRSPDSNSESSIAKL